MPIQGWSLRNREGKGRDVRAKLTLTDRNGTPTPGPGALQVPETELPAPDGQEARSTPPPGTAAKPWCNWSGVRLQVEVQADKFQNYNPPPGVWATVLSCPLPTYPPAVTNPPEVWEVRVYADRAGNAADRLCVTVWMMDGTGGWHILCDSAVVALPLP